MNVVCSGMLVAIVALAVALYFVDDADEEYVTPSGPSRTEKNLLSRNKPATLGDDDDGNFGIPQVNNLIRWIQNNGGMVDKRIAVRDGPFGRGVFLDGGDVVGDEEGSDPIYLYEIPQTIYLSTLSIENNKSAMRPLLVDPALQDLWSHETILLAISLLVERNKPDSFWRPYIETLPLSHPSQPLFWSDEELGELQSPAVVQQVQTARKWLRSHGEKLLSVADRYPTMFPKSKANLVDDFIWAYYTVTSRAFDVSRPGTNDSVLGLVPFVDLLNHAFTSPTITHLVTVHMPADIDHFTGKPTVLPLKQGAELSWQYKGSEARESSTKYLLSYGMVESDLTQMQDDFILLRDSAGGLWPVHWNGRVDSALFHQFPLDQVLSTVEQTIQELPTSLEDDKAALKSQTIRPVALLFRIRFKTVLQNHLEWLQQGARETGSMIQRGERQTAKAMFVVHL